MRKPKITIGIDPGSEVSGMALFYDKQIIKGRNVANADVIQTVGEWSGGAKCTVIIETLVAYGGRVRTETLQTCKWEGELCYRLSLERNVRQVLVARSTVKAWIFNACPEIVLPRLVKVMEAAHKRSVSKGKKGLVRADGSMRQASFQFIDDRIVVAAIKSLLSIPTPRPGRSNFYGLHSHSWQASALCAYFLLKDQPLIPRTT